MHIFHLIPFLRYLNELGLASYGRSSIKTITATRTGCDQTWISVHIVTAHPNLSYFTDHLPMTST